jgi:uncharacterized protein (DUF4415 family)
MSKPTTGKRTHAEQDNERDNERDTGAAPAEPPRRPRADAATHARRQQARAEAARRLPPGPGRTDWVAVDAMTDDDIRAQIAANPDAAPELDAAWFATAERYMPRETERITILVDRDVLDWFRAQGKGYQPRMNAVLRGYKEIHERAARRGRPDAAGGR